MTNDDAIETATVRVTTPAAIADAIAAGTDPEYEVGARVCVVMECVVDQVAVEPLNPKMPHPEDVLRRVHRLRAQSGAIVARQAVASILDDAAIAQERAEGVHRLPLAGDQ